VAIKALKEVLSTESRNKGTSESESNVT
jgi:hypothetical protein